MLGWARSKYLVRLRETRENGANGGDGTFPQTISTGARPDPLDLDRPSPQSTQCPSSRVWTPSDLQPPLAQRVGQVNQLLTETGNTQNRSTRHRLVGFPLGLHPTHSAHSQLVAFSRVRCTRSKLECYLVSRQRTLEKKKGNEKEKEKDKTRLGKQASLKQGLGHLAPRHHNRTTVALASRLASSLSAATRSHGQGI